MHLDGSYFCCSLILFHSHHINGDTHLAFFNSFFSTLLFSSPWPWNYFQFTDKSFSFLVRPCLGTLGTFTRFKIWNGELKICVESEFGWFEQIITLVISGPQCHASINNLVRFYGEYTLQLTTWSTPIIIGLISMFIFFFFQYDRSWSPFHFFKEKTLNSYIMYNYTLLCRLFFYFCLFPHLFWPLFM